MTPRARGQWKRVMKIKKYGRHFAVLDAHDALVCLCVYRKGAREVVRRLEKSNVASKKLLGANPAFRALMEDRRKESDSGKVSSLEDVRGRLDESA